jgi:hypothetical protein
LEVRAAFYATQRSCSTAGFECVDLAGFAALCDVVSDSVAVVVLGFVGAGLGLWQLAAQAWTRLASLAAAQSSHARTYAQRRRRA